MKESQKKAIYKWRATHRDQYNKSQRDARKKNPERYREYQIRYWQKKLESMKESEVN